MIINFTDLQIIKDENKNQIMFEGSGFDDLSDNYDNNFRSLMVFKKGYIEIFSTFTYTINNQKRMYKGPDSTVSFLSLIERFPTSDPTNNPDPNALNWLVRLFQSVESRSIATTNTMDRFQYRSLATPTSSISYEQVGFVYRVSNILSKKIKECVGLEYKAETLVRRLDSILLRCQMPWLNAIVDVEEPIQIKHLGFNEYLNFLLGPDLQRNINTFFEKNKIPHNKRLKKIIFNSVYQKKQKRETYQLNTLANGNGPLLRLKNGVYAEEEVWPDGSKSFLVTQHFSEGSIVIKWGKELKHCIASYIDKAARKEIMLLGVYVNDKLTYNAEIKIVSKQEVGNLIGFEKIKHLQDIKDPCCDIIQLRGMKNADADPKHRQIIEEIIDEWLNNLVLDRIDHSTHSELAQAQ